MWITKKHRELASNATLTTSSCIAKRQKEAEEILIQITQRMEQCKLELHPMKTKIVYCKDHRRKKKKNHINKFSSTFWDLVFNPDRPKDWKSGKIHNDFDLAISATSQKKITEEFTRMKIHRDSTSTIEEIADEALFKVGGLDQLLRQVQEVGLSPGFPKADLSVDAMGTKQVQVRQCA